MPKIMRWEILKTLDQLGTCYKDDFYLMLGSTPTSMFSSLLKEEFIETRTIPVQGRKRYKDEQEAIVRITSKGRRAYLEHVDDLRYHKTHFPGHNFYNHENVKKELWPYLTQQKVNILFHEAKVKVFPLEKPSLEYLWYTLSKPSTRQGVIRNVKSNYLDAQIEQLDESRKKEQVSNLLEEGIYYTKTEFRTLNNWLSEASQDTFKGVRFEGIYIQTNTCLVVFVSSYGENRRVSVPSQQLGNLLARIKHVFCNIEDPITNVKRVVTCMSDLSEPGKTYFHDVNALLISIGDSLTYSSATGYAHGITKRKYKGNGEYELVDSSSERFRMIFVVQDNLSGIDKLFYLTSRCLEDWYREFLNMISDSALFDVSKFNRRIPGFHREYRCPVLYMPVHEIKVYKEIRSENYESFCFVTNKNMADAISHSVEMTNGLHIYETVKTFFEAGEYEYEEDRVGEELGFNDFYLYDRFGYVAGIRKLEKFFYSKGFKTGSQSEYYKVPLWIGHPEGATKEFYNSIAKDELDLEKLFKLCKAQLIPIGETESKKMGKNKKGINFVLNAKYMAMFKELKEREHIKSSAELAKKLIIPELERIINETK